MDILSTENIAALLTLSILEIVLGIDNIIFISILVSRLEKSQQKLARLVGLTAAMLMRILLLLLISWLMLLTKPLFTAFAHDFSGKDLILIGGGLFLLAKSTHEMHEQVADEEEIIHRESSFLGVIVQVMLLDIVFSLDSVITAVGMSNNLTIMIISVVLAVLVMMLFSGKISDFIEENPTFKMLALAFLFLVGAMLIADGFGKHIEKGYIYFAIGFSLAVEALNMRTSKKRKNAV